MSGLVSTEDVPLVLPITAAIGIAVTRLMPFKATREPLRGLGNCPEVEHDNFF